MIDNLARDDLRGELAMADEAFALSPISARATQPSEADYEAIKDAFLETSRGRWFLTEYARRNRNADTRMVLDAVARIEGALAQPKPTSSGDLDETLDDILARVEAGRTRAATELDRLSVEQTLAPSYKDVQTIRQIVWTLRESGTDLRMCDLFDAQAKAIETSLDILTAASPRQAVLAVFDGLIGELNELADDAAQARDAAKPDAVVMPDAVATQAATAADQVSNMESEPATADPDSGADAASGAFAAPSASHPAATAPEARAFAAAGEAPAAALQTAVDDAPASAPEAQDQTPLDEIARDEMTRDEIAQDEAVLDLIADEMAAPDPDEFDAPPEPASSWPAAPEALATQTARETRIAAAMSRIDESFAQASLGAAALASGAVRRQPPPSRSRFAAIHRMTQVERVALFS